MMSAPDADAATASASPSPEDDQQQQQQQQPATASIADAHANAEPAPENATKGTDAAAEQPPAAVQADAPPVPSIRVSSMDVERESQKVRSLYESGDDLNWEDGGRVSFVERLEPTAEVPSEEEENVVYGFPCISLGCAQRAALSF
jgi:hypothetical protein